MALKDNHVVEGAAEIRQITREYERAKDRYETLMAAVMARYGKEALATALAADASEFTAEAARIEAAIEANRPVVVDEPIEEIKPE